MSKTRKSVGLACCRFIGKSNKLEILLVKKRYTYSFAMFVFGKYAKRDDVELKKLFNGMTVQEKIDIMSLRFDLLWYKIWLEFPTSRNTEPHVFDVSSVDAIDKSWKYMYKHKAMINNVPVGKSHTKTAFYIKKKNKFESAFLEDEGVRLRKLINGSSNTRLMWEIPKGRRNPHETKLDCAIREFEEETSISVDKYSIIFNIRPVTESFVSNNTVYINNYYIAYSRGIDDPCVDFKSNSQLTEGGDIKWVTVDEVQYLDRTGRLKKMVKIVFDTFLSKYKHEER
jgi:8-oxo-dGTP pyrophosphatase MutT (NUDIX family)